MQSTPVTASVEQAFRPAFEEIQRRSEAAHAQASETTFFARGSNPCQLPFELPEQEFVLLTIGTPVLEPVPLHADRPAARIYGAFPTRADAVEHAEIVRERDRRCSLLVVERDRWVLFPINEELRDDPERAALRRDAKLEAYRARRTDEFADFERAVAERRACTAAAPPPPEEEDPAEEAAAREAERLVYAPPKRLRAGAEVRGQAAAAVAVVRDEFGEVLLRVFGCFESAADAESWCRDVGSRRVTDHDLMIVSTCEWFYPNGDGRFSGNPRYRIGELQRIMDAATKNPQDVKDYKAWKREQDRLAAEREAQAEREGASEAAEEAEGAAERETQATAAPSGAASSE